MTPRLFTRRAGAAAAAAALLLAVTVACVRGRRIALPAEHLQQGQKDSGVWALLDGIANPIAATLTAPKAAVERRTSRHSVNRRPATTQGAEEKEKTLPNQQHELEEDAQAHAGDKNTAIYTRKESKHALAAAHQSSPKRDAGTGKQAVRVGAVEAESADAEHEGAFINASKEEAGRQAAMEDMIEALRRQSAQHDIRRTLQMQADHHVLAPLDAARKRSRIYGFMDAAKTQAAAGAKAAAREQKMQAQIRQYAKLGELAQEQHTREVRAVEKFHEAEQRKHEVSLFAHAARQAEQSIFKPEERMSIMQKDGKAEETRESKFEARVEEYRKAEHAQAETYRRELALHREAFEPERKVLKQQALARPESKWAVGTDHGWAPHTTEAERQRKLEQGIQQDAETQASMEDARKRREIKRKAQEKLRLKLQNIQWGEALRSR